MGILDIFKSKQPEEPSAKFAGEIGYAFSNLYSASDFPRYNPDSLLTFKGNAIYDKMLTDDQVKAVLLFKQYAVISRDWYFDIEQDDNGEDKADHVEMAAFFEHAIKQIRGAWIDVLLKILSALKYGFSVCEVMYAPIMFDGKSYWGIKDVKLRPFETFRFATDEHGNIEKILQIDTASHEIEIPADKVIHFVHQPDIDAHYGESDLRSAYRAYWSKDIDIKLWNIYLEYSAGGFVAASYEGKLETKQMDDLKEVVKNIQARTGIIHPGNVELNMFNPVQNNNYEQALAAHDKAIAKSLLVPNLLGLSEQGKTGSYSQSQTQLDAFFWVLDAIASRLSEQLNEDIFRRLALWNFANDDYPLYTFEAISDEKKNELAKTWNELVKGGSVTKTDEDENWLRRTMGAPKKPEVEEIEGPPIEQPQLDDWIDAQPQQQQDFILKEFAEKPWLKRVNFARIEIEFDRNETRLSDELNDAMAHTRRIFEKQIIKIGGDKSWGNVKTKELENINMPTAVFSAIRKTLRINLANTLDESYQIAKRELPARKFKRIQPGMDKKQAEKFLSSKAMLGARAIEKTVLEQVYQVLFNAIKYDKTLAQTLAALSEIDQSLALLPDFEVIIREGKEIVRAINKPARLENIARTNIAEAVNQARQALFTDPELRGFVQAYEYSAILDSRTTDICEHLNGKILRDFSTYMPPNHYMCRSVLAPITVVDDWDGKESPKPRIEPQKGFF
jgi:SPP1 gp7 family putative phage head morphogenesis protein